MQSRVIGMILFFLTFFIIPTLTSATSTEFQENQDKSKRRKALSDILDALPKIDQTINQVNAEVNSLLVNLSLPLYQLQREITIKQDTEVLKKFKQKKAENPLDKKKLMPKRSITSMVEANSLYLSLEKWIHRTLKPIGKGLNQFIESTLPSLEHCILDLASTHEDISRTFRLMTTQLAENPPDEVQISDLLHYMVNQWILTHTKTLYGRMVPHILDFSTTVSTLRRITEEMNREREILYLLASKKAPPSTEQPNPTGLFSYWRSSTIISSSKPIVEINDVDIKLKNKGTYPPYRIIKRQDPIKFTNVLHKFYDTVAGLKDEEIRTRYTQVVYVLKSMRSPIRSNQAPEIFTYDDMIDPQVQLTQHVGFIQYHKERLEEYIGLLRSGLDVYLENLRDNLAQIQYLGIDGLKSFHENLENEWIDITKIESFKEHFKQPGEQFLQELSQYIDLYSNISGRVEQYFQPGTSRSRDVEFAEDVSQTSVLLLDEEVSQNRISDTKENLVRNLWFFSKQCEDLTRKKPLKADDTELAVRDLVFSRWFAQQIKKSPHKNQQSLYEDILKLLLDKSFKSLELTRGMLAPLQDKIDPQKQKERAEKKTKMRAMSGSKTTHRDSLEPLLPSIHLPVNLVQSQVVNSTDNN